MNSRRCTTSRSTLALFVSGKNFPTKYKKLFWMTVLSFEVTLRCGDPSPCAPQNRTKTTTTTTVTTRQRATLHDPLDMDSFVIRLHRLEKGWQSRSIDTIITKTKKRKTIARSARERLFSRIVPRTSAREEPRNNPQSRTRRLETRAPRVAPKPPALPLPYRARSSTPPPPATRGHGTVCAVPCHRFAFLCMQRQAFHGVAERALHSTPADNDIRSRGRRPKGCVS